MIRICTWDKSTPLRVSNQPIPAKETLLIVYYPSFNSSKLFNRKIQTEKVLKECICIPQQRSKHYCTLLYCFSSNLLVLGQYRIKQKNRGCISPQPPNHSGSISVIIPHTLKNGLMPCSILLGHANEMNCILASWSKSTGQDALHGSFDFILV